MSSVAMLRVFRAILGITLMWALAWLPIGGAVALYAASSPPQPSDVISRPVSVPLFLTVWTVWGGMSGAAFALILKFTERRRSLGGRLGGDDGPNRAHAH